MAREPKPWYRADRKTWCVTIHGKRHNLGRNKRDAMQRFYALVQQPREQQAVSSAGLPALVDAFLEWTHQNRASETYRWYRDHLQRFVKKYPTLAVEQLRPFHVETWAAERGENVNTRRNRMRAVKRCLRWAIAQGYLERNPIGGMEIPAAQPRDVYIPSDEFQTLLSFVQEPNFADLLRVTYETGCRPQESLCVEARHLDLDQARWVFPRSESKGKSMPRIVYLTEEAMRVSTRLAKAWPTGVLFRNSNGRPWHPYSMSCAFDRVQHRMGRAIMEAAGETIPADEVEACVETLAPTRKEGGEVVQKSSRVLLGEARRKLLRARAKQIAPRYSLYALRHSWATNALRSGVDPLTVAILMGHKDPSMLARTYQHLSHDPKHLLRQARRVES